MHHGRGDRGRPDSPEQYQLDSIGAREDHSIGPPPFADITLLYVLEFNGALPWDIREN